MSSPPSAQVGEVATVVRHLEGRVCGDVSSEASSDAAEDFELPECKIKRNYNCTKCTFYTQNPRAYLVHTRDAHFVRLKIYDCPHCVYASRHHQKLIRHVKMVHGGSKPNAAPAKVPPTLPAAELSPPPVDNMEPAERIEDMLEEVEDCEDMMMEVDEDSMDRPDNIDGDCDRNVDYASPSYRRAHLSKAKGRYFSCDKCNYVTHIRARFTKHVKYHSMPMIKCTMCDFRTPYKWNLDRHMKNHGGSGSFNCSMCNFTADIKQSLTVHEMNHHTPPAGQSLSSRRRNRVGASDAVSAELDAASALLPKEEEGSGDSRSSHSVSVSRRVLCVWRGAAPAAGTTGDVTPLSLLSLAPPHMDCTPHYAASRNLLNHVYIIACLSHASICVARSSHNTHPQYCTNSSLKLTNLQN